MRDKSNEARDTTTTPTTAPVQDEAGASTRDGAGVGSNPQASTHILIVNRAPQDDDIPGWWKEHALRGWITATAERMRSHPDQLQPATPHSRKRLKKFPDTPTKRLKTEPLPLRFCTLSVRGINGDITLVQVKDLVKKEFLPVNGAEDLNDKDLELELLHAQLAKEGVFDIEKQRLIYITKGLDGDRDVAIRAVRGLRTAVVTMRKAGDSVISGIQVRDIV
ncbi:hypothetical protein W97_05895 [Coniosporium apollinis CBS 100218]|uniref:Uncharacterized protein n=1 Tax=Coniosporium apollinis (strain CBS 100218) TaxID=1168221 RepID=R7YXZ6_CONA1|nr:uncharacterized protein W97_05895 [Coniosporium apollinis CBS 100218]EON66649.1 hypothetical protein W97_05895 [Coniosporium apollinis CBS 100218]